jgi:hypothetical protein
MLGDRAEQMYNLISLSNTTVKRRVEDWYVMLKITCKKDSIQLILFLADEWKYGCFQQY